MLRIEKVAKGVQVTENKIDDFSGSYIFQPLYRGYGNTVGNALRRVLLSSIPGGAIKGVRIDGVYNEFSVMEGVKESVVDIVLNVKEIVVKCDEAGEKKMSLKVKGPIEVKAGDIIPDAGLTIVNPEQLICTITTDREINMEFMVDTGEGFVVSEEVDKEGWPVEYIAIDAIYTPIKKVSYKVEDTMVGRQTDFDKLTLDITTDGSIDIRNAISYAVELLQLHLNPILEIGDKMESLRTPMEEEENTEELIAHAQEEDVLKMKIEELDLTVRSFNCLKKAGIEEVGQLSKMSYSELLKIKNLGKKSLEEILEKMKSLGFDLQAAE